MALSCDTFERADGDLGSAWASVPYLWQEPARPLVIVGGAAEDGQTADDGFTGYSASRYLTAQGPNQFIEAEISRLWQPGPALPSSYHEATLLTNMTTTDQSLRMCTIAMDANAGFGPGNNVRIDIFNWNADGVTYAEWSFEQYTFVTGDSMRVRFDSDADGTCRVYVNGGLLFTWVDPNPAPGSFVGIAAHSEDHSDGTSTQFVPSVRYDEVCFPGVVVPSGGGGWSVGIGWANSAAAIMALSGTSFTDDFERADLGPDWADDGPIFVDWDYLRAGSYLSDGAYVTTPTDENFQYMGSIRRIPQAGTDQFIEAEVGNFFQGHIPTLPERLQIVEGQVYLFAQLAPDSYAGIGVWIIIDSGGPGATAGQGKCYMEVITTDAAGTVTEYGYGDTFPLTGWQSNPVYTVRLEVTAAGHVRGFFEGGLLVEEDVPPTGGQHLGVAMEWNQTRYDASVPLSGESTRFYSVTGSEKGIGGGWSVG